LRTFQGAPDLLPGLCLYGERWLQRSRCFHFDCGKEASLKNTFADEQVQAYLKRNMPESSAKPPVDGCTDRKLLCDRYGVTRHQRTSHIFALLPANRVAEIEYYYTGQAARRGMALMVS